MSSSTEAVEGTFNAVTIDGDTSTSDTLLLFATGSAAARGAPHIGLPDDPRLENFKAALTDLMRDLALQVVKDGEGLTKFVTIRVIGAESDRAAKAHRQLDRQLAAGEDRDRRRGSELGPHRHGRGQGWRGRRPRQTVDLARRHPGGQGRRGAPDYREGLGAAYMQNAEIGITVDVGVGPGARPCTPAI